MDIRFERALNDLRAQKGEPPLAQTTHRQLYEKIHPAFIHAVNGVRAARGEPLHENPLYDRFYRTKPKL